MRNTGYAAIVALVLANLTGTLGCDGGCESDSDCDDDEYCTAEPGSGDTGDCMEQKGTGASCEDNRECRDTLWCSGGKCEKPPPGTPVGQGIGDAVTSASSPKCSVGQAGHVGSTPLGLAPIAAAFAAAVVRRRRRPR